MAETCALTEALSEVTWVSKWIAMAKNKKYVWTENQQPDREIQIQTILKSTSSDLQVALATDAKSVYDNVRKHQEAYTNHDKRVSLELAVVRDGLRTIGGECRWVPHFANPADCFTKVKGNVDRLLQLMQTGIYGLVDEAQTIQERQQQRADGVPIPRPSSHTNSASTSTNFDQIGFQEYSSQFNSGANEAFEQVPYETVEHFDFDVGLLKLSGV
eukprot:5422647-Amphidinium_carterae.1